MLAGAVASAQLAVTLGHPLWTVILGMIVGAAYSASLRPTPRAYVDNLMAGAALGIPLWGLISVIAIPLFSGEMPQWSAEQMRTHFPALVAWVLYGALLGLITQGLTDITERALGSDVEAASPAPQEKKRIVILGGGFAGMRTAECLEKELRDDHAVSIGLVSDTNALLFTPMLAEVAGSSLEPSHISTPLRSSLHRTEFIRGRVSKIDLEGRRVILGADHAFSKNDLPREIPYDQLVLALGSVSNYLGMPNVEKLAFNFKSLLDAIRIRNHVIEMFESADREPDSVLRRTLLTFVIAGGGFAGVELAGALNDFAHGILADYPNLHPEDLSVV
ncbi:MAG: FAD-dependent oxidoreductase, partial [Candidatus Acidiferrales bacterium]